MRLFNVHISFICVIISTITCAEIEKRAPMGFTGVRGKKSINESPYNTDMAIEDTSRPSTLVDDNVGIIEKRAPSGFMGMRGKKPYEEYIPLDYSMIYYKRAPSGFFGMRGKKDMMDDYEKRAPSGFMGMRGKKDYDIDEMDKRAPSGFFGMRGKKNYEVVFDETKRAAPPSGFFGMRGKKQTARSGFFGMRGKKYPYEFRGKFVGVRGKKMSNDVIDGDIDDNNNNMEEDVTRLGQQLDLNQLMLLLTENSQNNVDNYYAQD